MSDTVYVLGAGINQSIKDTDGLSPPMIRDFFRIALQKEKEAEETVYKTWVGDLFTRASWERWFNEKTRSYEEL